ncbi:MAG: DUF6261 family protein [Verrucomicrobiales bacterium]|jgi:hypothetical protein|nr:DUF6261 family protein [Verrucomicrobiales bacterium]
MKIHRIRYYRLQNEEWFQHGLDLKSLLAANGPAALNVQAGYTQLTDLLQQADAALEPARKSDLTAKITEADEKRDRLYRGFVASVKANLDSYDVTHAAAARIVLDVIERYHSQLATQNYNKETALIYNLAQDLHAQPAWQQVQVLQLQNWLVMLESANNDFKQLLNQRYAETAAQVHSHMQTIRRAADLVIKQIFDFVDVFAISVGAPVFETFITAYNARADYYAHTLATREGVRAAAAKKKEETGEGQA